MCTGCVQGAYRVCAGFRAGSTSAFWTPYDSGDLPNEYSSETFILANGFDLRTYAWYSANNSSNIVKTIAGKIPNDFGLYDMSGNVPEWTHDSYLASLENAPVIDPDMNDNSTKVIRGGGWNDNPSSLRSARRSYLTHSARSRAVGFRIARTY